MTVLFHCVPLLRRKYHLLFLLLLPFHLESNTESSRGPFILKRKIKADVSRRKFGEVK